MLIEAGDPYGLIVGWQNDRRRVEFDSHHCLSDFDQWNGNEKNCAKRALKTFPKPKAHREVNVPWRFRTEWKWCPFLGHVKLGTSIGCLNTIRRLNAIAWNGKLQPFQNPKKDECASQRSTTWLIWFLDSKSKRIVYKEFVLRDQSTRNFSK